MYINLLQRGFLIAVRQTTFNCYFSLRNNYGAVVPIGENRCFASTRLWVQVPSAPPARNCLKSVGWHEQLRMVRVVAERTACSAELIKHKPNSFFDQSRMVRKWWWRYYARIAQQGERKSYKLEAPGSIPVAGTNRDRSKSVLQDGLRFREIARLVNWVKLIWWHLFSTISHVGSSPKELAILED